MRQAASAHLKKGGGGGGGGGSGVYVPSLILISSFFSKSKILRHPLNLHPSLALVVSG